MSAGSYDLSYDAAGRLVEEDGTATTQFLYDGADVIAEYDASGNLLRRYVHEPGANEPLVWLEGSGTSDRRFLMADERGSVVAVTDDAGAVLHVNKYSEYGAPAAGNIGRFQYTGQMWLAEAGLYHYKARAYNPGTGRFMQTDPIGYGDGMNLYAYVGNDPVNATDPTGLEECEGDCVYSYGTPAPCGVGSFCFQTMMDQLSQPQANNMLSRRGGGPGGGAGGDGLGGLLEKEAGDFNKEVLCGATVTSTGNTSSGYPFATLDQARRYAEAGIREYENNNIHVNGAINARIRAGAIITQNPNGDGFQVYVFRATTCTEKLCYGFPGQKMSPYRRDGVTVDYSGKPVAFLFGTGVSGTSPWRWDEERQAGPDNIGDSWKAYLNVQIALLVYHMGPGNDGAPAESRCF